MFYLTDSADKIEVLLGGSPVTQCPWFVSFVEGDDVAGVMLTKRARGTTNGVSAVTIMAGPSAPPIERAWRTFMLHNPAANGAVVVTIRITASGTTSMPFNLDAGDLLQYVDGEGWKVTDATGALKTTATSSGGSGTLTVTDGSVTALNVDSITVDAGDLTDDGGGAVTIATSGGGGGGAAPSWFTALALGG